MKDLRAVLKEPYLLNLVLAIFALERTYELWLEEERAWGHAIALTIYLLGFLVGLDFSDDGTERGHGYWAYRNQKIKKEKLFYTRRRRFAYALLFAGTLWGLFIIWTDVCNKEMPSVPWTTVEMPSVPCKYVVSPIWDLIA